MPHALHPCLAPEADSNKLPFSPVPPNMVAAQAQYEEAVAITTVISEYGARDGQAGAQQMWQGGCLPIVQLDSAVAASSSCAASSSDKLLEGEHKMEKPLLPLLEKVWRWGRQAGEQGCLSIVCAKFGCTF